MSAIVTANESRVLTETELAQVAWEMCNRASIDPDYAHILTGDQWQQLGKFMQSVRLLFTSL